MPDTPTEKDNQAIRVLIVDDHDMLREGLMTFLTAFHDLEMVGETSSGHEALSLCEERRPDVVLMDLIMPEMDGVTAIEAIHKRFPEIRIIALSSFGEEKLVRNAIRAGATSYLLKNISAENLAEAIRVAYKGLPTLAPEITQQIMTMDSAEPVTYSALTERERDVLDQMVDGISNAEIAQKLEISKFTVKNHVSNILSKLGVTSRTEAVSKALQEGIVHKN